MSQLDSAKIAGLLAIGAVLVLVGLRRGFGSITVRVGD